MKSACALRSAIAALVVSRSAAAVAAPIISGASVEKPGSIRRRSPGTRPRSSRARCSRAAGAPAPTQGQHADRQADRRVQARARAASITAGAATDVGLLGGLAARRLLPLRLGDRARRDRDGRRWRLRSAPPTASPRSPGQRRRSTGPRRASGRPRRRGLSPARPASDRARRRRLPRPRRAAPCRASGGDGLGSRFGFIVGGTVGRRTAYKVPDPAASGLLGRDRDDLPRSSARSSRTWRAPPRAPRLGGGAEKIARQHAAGKLTARERIDLLFDDGVFFELGAHGGMGLAARPGRQGGAGRRRRHRLRQGRRAHGRASPPTTSRSRAAASATTGEKKVTRLREMALRGRLPIVWFVDSAGARDPGGAPRHRSSPARGTCSASRSS